LPPEFWNLHEFLFSPKFDSYFSRSGHCLFYFNFVFFGCPDKVGLGR